MRKRLSLFFVFLILFQSVAWAEPESSDSAQITDPPAALPTTTPQGTPQPTLANGTLLSGILKEDCQGDAVITLQSRLRDLGYYTYKITGFFGSFTKDAVAHFQRVNKLMVDGTVGPETLDFLYSNKAVRRPIEEERLAAEAARIKAEQDTLAKAKAAAAAKANALPKKGELWDWFKKVNKAIPRGSKFRVMDLRTGITYNMVRVGGSLHADVEPATKDDCAKFKKTYGGTWSYSRRPVLVRIGSTWVAASTNGQPHGYETVANNNMKGQVCIHFLNSRTHIRNAKDSDHQTCVMRAAGK